MFVPRTTFDTEEKWRVLQSWISGPLRVCPQVRFFMEDLGLRRLQLTKVMRRSPQLLGNSVEDKMRVNVRALKASSCLIIYPGCGAFRHRCRRHTTGCRTLFALGGSCIDLRRAATNHHALTYRDFSFSAKGCLP